MQITKKAANDGSRIRKGNEYVIACVAAALLHFVLLRPSSRSEGDSHQLNGVSVGALFIFYTLDPIFQVI